MLSWNSSFRYFGIDISKTRFKMRRMDRALTKREEIESILQQCQFGTLSTSNNGIPYGVPLSYGFIWDNNLKIYVHSASIGRKIDAIKGNPLVSFSGVSFQKIKPVHGKNSCSASHYYYSFIAEGIARFLIQDAEKIKALNAILTHYNQPQLPFNPKIFKKTTCIEIDVKEIMGKTSTK